MDDIVYTTHRPQSGSGTDGDDRFGAYLGTFATGVSLSGRGSLSTALLGQALGTPIAGAPSLVGGPVGVHTLGQPFGNHTAGGLLGQALGAPFAGDPRLGMLGQPRRRGPPADPRPRCPPRWGGHGGLRRSTRAPIPRVAWLARRGPGRTGSDTAVFRVVPEARAHPTDRWMGSPRARGEGPATRVPEPPAPPTDRQASGFAVNPEGGGGGVGYVVLWAEPEPPVPYHPLGRIAHVGRGAPEVGQVLHGSDTADNPFTFFGKQVNNIMTNHAVAMWGQPTPRLWQVLCGGRLASM